MSVMVALLRGINVGGSGKLTMDELRAAATESGATDVRTYIQSGNLVVRTSRRSTRAVADALGRAVADRSGLSPVVHVRTRDELATVVEQVPYGDVADARQLHVVFSGDPTAAALDGLDLDAYAPEHATAVDRQLYLWLPDGIGRSKLAGDVVRRLPDATARNWRTVTTLLALADELA